MMEHFSLKDFKPKTNYVLEASAGTGKTYNIVEIVKKLVNEHNYKLEEILIVTYTDKAAGELKDRIRKGLNGQNVAGAPIFTIHSFCQDAIKCFGVSAGLPLSLDVISDVDLYDFADRYVREGDILKDIVSVLMVKPDFSFDRLIRIFLCAALNKYYLGKTYDEDPKVIELEPLPDHLKQLVPFLLEIKEAKKIEDLFNDHPDIRTHYQAFKNSNAPKAQDFATELEKKFSENFNFDGSKFKVSTDWSDDADLNEDLKESFLFFYNLKDYLGSFGTELYQFLTLRYLKDFYEKWQLEKERNKEQTFNDMIRFVRESVLDDDSPMLKKLRAKYKYAIIDEFQDTNQIQFDIFSRVFMCEGHNIIVVGDPKQSIYSFQGADVSVYHKAKDIIEKNGGLVCDLNKNYRSAANMVDSCNALFQFYDFKGTTFEDCGALSRDRGDDFEHQAQYEGAPTQAFWIAKDELDENQFAKIAVETIVDCCRKDQNGKTKLQVTKGKDDPGFRDVSFKDFAVLARARSEMVAIEGLLREAGIPFIRYKDTNLYKGKECADWIALLAALNLPDFTGRNRKLFKKTLFTQFFEKSIKSASDEKFSADDNDAIRLFKKWKQVAEERRWEDLFDDILVSSGLLERMSYLNRMQSLGIYKQIANSCVEYLSNNHSLEELIKRLSALAKGASDDDVQTGPIVEKSTDFDAVQVMTMHASKGLEFPVVIAVAGFKNPQTDVVVTYHLLDQNGESHHLLGFENDENGEYIDSERTEEFKRLFYVGYTRAKFVLILPNYGEQFFEDFLKESVPKFIENHPDKFRVLNDSGKEGISYLKDDVKQILKDCGERDQSSDQEEARKKQDEALRKVIRILPGRATYKHSYSSFSHAGSPTDEGEDEKVAGLEAFDKKAVQIALNMDEASDRDSLSSSYPRGARTGTALHEVFEKIDFANYSDNLEIIIAQAFKNQHMRLSDTNAKATVNMVKNVLEAKLPGIQGSKAVEGDFFALSSIAKEDKRAEVEFNFNYQDEWLKNYCTGFIDLLFKRGDRYCLLDWKSDSLNEDFTSYADNEALKKHVDEAYSIQRVLYSYCLIKWLKAFHKDLSEEEIFSRYFGGIYYVFLRGCVAGESNGVYCQTWKSWDDLKAAYEGIITNKTGGKNND